MTQPINLNTARKAKARADKKVRADANAVKFGRTKAQKLMDRVETRKSDATLDASKLDQE